jgi:DNA end-binding protein Ku
MARPIWSGSLSFGLVNVPVQLHGTLRDRDVHFRQLHDKDGAPIQTRRYCEAEDVEVPFEQIGHGYDLDGKQVVLSDAELDAAAPRKTRTIDIEAFVDTGALDPLLMDRTYLVVPAGDTDGVRRAYRLLRDAMDDGGQVALGRLVLRAKEHLVAVGPRDGMLALRTMRFHDEIRPAADVDGGSDARKPSAAKVKAAVQLIDELAAEWDPTRYEDRHRRRLLDAVKGADRTETVEEEREERPAVTPDLMDALTRSLRRARGEEGRAAAGGEHGGDRKPAAGEGLMALSRDELYERAQQADLPGRSSMTKAQLVKALS